MDYQTPSIARIDAAWRQHGLLAIVPFGSHGQFPICEHPWYGWLYGCFDGIYVYSIVHVIVFGTHVADVDSSESSSPDHCFHSPFSSSWQQCGNAAKGQCTEEPPPAFASKHSYWLSWWGTLVISGESWQVVVIGCGISAQTRSADCPHLGESL